MKVTYTARSLAAELLGIRKGLLLCHHHEKIQKCEILNDNLVAVNTLNLHTNHWCTITPLILECRELLQKFNDVKIEHTRREYNTLANCLAKQARSLDDCMNITREHPNPPNFCMSTYISDCNNSLFTT